MTVLQTTRTILLLTGIAGVSCFYLVSEFLLQNRFSILEEEAVRHQLERSVNIYERALDALDRSLQMSASQIHLSEPSPSDPARTLSHKTNDAVDLSVLHEDTKGLISARRSLIGPATFQPDRLIDRIIVAGLDGQAFRGLIELDSEFYLVVSRPGNSSNPRFILGLDRFPVDSLQRSGLGSGLLKLSYRNTSEWDSKRLSEILAADGSVVSQNDRSVSGFHLFNDVFGEPAAILRIDYVRNHDTIGSRNRNLLLSLFGAFLLGSGYLITTAIRRNVFKPIERLSQSLAQIARDGQDVQSVPVSGSVEVGRLETQVNEMLDRLRQSESHLIRTERMRVAGELSAGVSHNLNNILTGILGPAEFLEQNLEDPEQLAEARRIYRASIRARDLVSRFGQAVRHGAPLRSRAVEINSTVRTAIEASRPRWQDESQGEGVQIAIETDLRATLPIQGTPDELHDIIVSLVLNATDALPEGGTVRITTEDANGNVILCVSDDGIGMNDETVKRVFEPFFTTKASIGSGLGLAAVHGVATRWGGTVHVSSTLGTGSEFTVELPRSWETLPNLSARTLPAEPTNRSGRILIVEDDELVCEVLTTCLADHELTVIRDGQEACDALRTNIFDVALIDLSLPNVPGDRIARKLRNVDPTVVSVLMTGWDLGEDDPRRVPFDDHIPKPISSREDVRSIVARSLEVHDARALRS